MYYSKIFKRCIDVIVSFTGLLFLSPVFLILTLLLCVVNNNKPFFFQLRPGKDHTIFKVIKFRTMNEKKDSLGNLLPDADRLTKTGKFVRSTSLDELPQLINVLRGDMSLIGPRPLLQEYLPLYSREQSRRHSIRPGITGWAQVNGRNTISWQQKFEYDVWYVDHISFVLDVKIVVMTIRKVFVREGINSKSGNSMDLFTGNN